jgi:hypothetical protein
LRFLNRAPFCIWKRWSSNYSWRFGTAEPSGILSSFAFFLACIIGHEVINRKGTNPLEMDAALSTKRCLKSLLVVTILSVIYHSFLNWQTQIMDEIGVLQAQVTYYTTTHKISNNLWITLLIFSLLGLLHPLFPGIMIFYIWFLTTSQLQILCLDFPELQQGAKISLWLSVGAISFGALDSILCPWSKYVSLHSLAHVGLALYCLQGAMIYYNINILRQKSGKNC